MSEQLIKSLQGAKLMDEDARNSILEMQTEIEALQSQIDELKAQSGYVQVSADEPTNSDVLLWVQI